MKPFHISNIPGMKLAINCEDQQSAKKVLSVLAKFGITINDEWTASTPVLVFPLNGERFFGTFHYAKKRNYRIITDVIFLADNPQVEQKFDNVMNFISSIDDKLLENRRKVLDNFLALTEMTSGRRSALEGINSFLADLLTAVEKDKAGKG